jgi:hypothetical protein
MGRVEFLSKTLFLWSNTTHRGEPAADANLAVGKYFGTEPAGPRTPNQPFPHCLLCLGRAAGVKPLIEIQCKWPLARPENIQTCGYGEVEQLPRSQVTAMAAVAGAFKVLMPRGRGGVGVRRVVAHDENATGAEQIELALEECRGVLYVVEHQAR